MTDSSGETRELSQLEQVSLRLSLASDNQKLQSHISAFLPPVLMLLDAPSKSPKTRAKVVEILQTVTRILRSHTEMTVPLDRLLSQFDGEAVSDTQRNFLLVFIKMGLERSAPELAVVKVIGLLVGISRRPAHLQISLLQLLVLFFHHFPSVGSPSQRDEKLPFLSQPADRRFVFLFLLDVLLSVPSTFSSPLPSPGLSISAQTRLKDTFVPNKTTELPTIKSLGKTKEIMIRWLSQPSIASDSEIFLHSVVASVDGTHHVSSIGDDLLKRVIANNSKVCSKRRPARSSLSSLVEERSIQEEVHDVQLLVVDEEEEEEEEEEKEKVVLVGHCDFENKETVESMIRLYNGTISSFPSASPSPSSSSAMHQTSCTPASPFVRQKLLHLLTKSVLAANYTTELLVMINDGMRGPGSNTSSRRNAMNLLMWVIRYCSAEKFEQASISIVTAIFSIVEEHQSSSQTFTEDLLQMAFSCFGPIAKRNPQLILSHRSLLSSLFSWLRQTSDPSAKPALQDSIVIILRSIYPIVRQDEGLKQWLSEVLLESARINHPSTVYPTLLGLVYCFGFSDPRGRWFCLRDGARIECRDLALRGLKPYAVRDYLIMDDSTAAWPEFSLLVDFFDQQLSFKQDDDGKDNDDGDERNLEATKVSSAGVLSLSTYSLMIQFLSKSLKKSANQFSSLESTAQLSSAETDDQRHDLNSQRLIAYLRSLYQSNRDTVEKYLHILLEPLYSNAFQGEGSFDLQLESLKALKRLILHSEAVSKMTLPHLDKLYALSFSGHLQGRDAATFVVSCAILSAPQVESTQSIIKKTADLIRSASRTTNDLSSWRTQSDEISGAMLIAGHIFPRLSTCHCFLPDLYSCLAFGLMLPLSSSLQMCRMATCSSLSSALRTGILKHDIMSQVRFPLNNERQLSSTEKGSLSPPLRLLDLIQNVINTSLRQISSDSNSRLLLLQALDAQSSLWLGLLRFYLIQSNIDPDIGLAEHEISIALHSILGNLLPLSTLKQQEDLHFSVGESLALLGVGWASPAAIELFEPLLLVIAEESQAPTQVGVIESGLRKASEEKMKQHFETILDAIVCKLTKGETSAEISAASIWLLSLTHHGARHYALQERLAEIQQAFTCMLAHPQEIVQEVGSKGLILVHRLAREPKVKQELLQNLTRSLVSPQDSTLAPPRLKLASDSAFLATPADSNSQSSAGEGGLLTTYGSICSAAEETGQPQLLYSFLEFASQHQLWLSQKGAAFTASALASSEARQQLRKALPYMLPRLYCAAFDPYDRLSQPIQQMLHSLTSNSESDQLDDEPSISSLSSLSSSSSSSSQSPLLSESAEVQASKKGGLREVLLQQFDAVAKELLRSLKSNFWRSKEAALGGWAQLLTLARPQDLIQHISSLITELFRALDYNKQSVVLSAVTVCKTLRDTLERCSNDATLVESALRPIIDRGLSHEVEAARSFTLTCLLTICKASPRNVLRPHLTAILPCLLEAVANDESLGVQLNYLSQHSERLGMSSDRLEAIRVQAAQEHPVQEALKKRVLPLIDNEVARDAAVHQILLQLSSAVGFQSRIAAASLLDQLISQKKALMKTIGPVILKKLIAILQKGHPSLSVRKAVCTSTALSASICGPKATQTLLLHITDLYLDGEQPSASSCLSSSTNVVATSPPLHSQHSPAFLILQLARLAAEKLGQNMKEAIPLVFLGMSDCADERVKNTFELAWSEMGAGGLGLLNLHLDETIKLILRALESQSWLKKRQAAVACAQLASSCQSDRLRHAVFQSGLFPKLLQLLPGKLWNQKEQLFGSISKLVAICDPNESEQDLGILQNVVSSISVEVVRSKLEYRRAAVDCLCSLLSQIETRLSVNQSAPLNPVECSQRVQQIYDRVISEQTATFLFTSCMNFVEEATAAPTSSPSNFDEDEVKSRPLRILIGADAFRLIGLLWSPLLDMHPSGLLLLQSFLDVVTTIHPFCVWNILIKMMEATGKAIECLLSCEFRCHVNEPIRDHICSVIGLLTNSAKDRKYASVRESAILSLIKITQAALIQQEEEAEEWPRLKNDILSSIRAALPLTSEAEESDPAAKLALSSLLKMVLV